MTSTSKHTPGPWAVRGPSCVEGQGPFERVARYWPGAGYQIIADCSHTATSGTDCEANARLIAAAPDLLKALFDMRCCFGHASDPEVEGWWESRIPDYEDSPSSGQIRSDVIEAARSAITKATGEA